MSSARDQLADLLAGLEGPGDDGARSGCSSLVGEGLDMPDLAETVE